MVFSFAGTCTGKQKKNRKQENSQQVPSSNDVTTMEVDPHLFDYRAGHYSVNARLVGFCVVAIPSDTSELSAGLITTTRGATGSATVSYTHLTLPTKA